MSNRPPHRLGQTVGAQEYSMPGVQGRAKHCSTGDSSTLTRLLQQVLCSCRKLCRQR